MRPPHTNDDGRDGRGRFTRNDKAPPDPKTAGKGAKKVFFKHFKVDELLPEEHKPEYEKLMRDPRTTVPVLQAFLRKLGINLSRNAVANHRIHAHLEVKRVQEMSLIAKAFCELTRQEGSGNVAEATHTKFELKLMEFLFKDEDAPLLSPEQLERIGRITRRAVQTRLDVETLHEDCAQRERKAAKAAEEARKPKLTEQQRRIELVRRVDEIMGIRRPQQCYKPDPEPDDPPSESQPPTPEP